MRLKNFRALKSRSRDCVIFGSGPSLDTLSNYLEFLKGKDLVGCNFVCEHAELEKMEFQFYSIIDRDYSRNIDAKFLENLKTEYILIAEKNMYSIPLQTLCRNRTKIIKSEPFNLSSYYSGTLAEDKIFTGNSVPFLIQCLAKYASYDKIYLLGIDHYPGPVNNAASNFKGYTGRKLKKLDISQHKLEYIEGLFEYSLECCAKRGIGLFNATPNTHLEVIPKYKI